MPRNIVFLEKLLLIFKYVYLELFLSKISSDIEWKHTKNDKNVGLKNKGQVPTIEPESEFFRTCQFREVLDNLELLDAEI